MLDEALETHMPHKIANYLYELCQDYNAFYNSEPILKAEEPSKSLRLALTSLQPRSSRPEPASSPFAYPNVCEGRILSIPFP